MIDSPRELAEKSRMHILHLLSQTELTGAEVYAKVLIETQVKQDLKISVISDRMHVQLPVPWISFSISTSSFFERMKNIWKLRKFLLHEKISVIHCHSRGAARHSYWARWGLPVAMLTTLHGRQHFSWSKRFLHIYGELQIAVCENVRTAMAHSFGMPISAIRVLRNPIPAPQVNQVSTEGLHLALVGRSSGPKGECFEKISFQCFESWLKKSPQLKISILAPQPENFSSAFHTHWKALQNLFPQRLSMLGAVAQLPEKLGNYGMVIASGRIAAEALLAKTEVLAIGEYKTIGLVTEKNLKQCLESNFGDMGAKGEDVLLDLHKIQTDVDQWLQGNHLNITEKNTLAEKVSAEFDPIQISRNILELYRAARFKRHVPHWIPILMYHKIPDSNLKSQHQIFVTRKNFARHLQFFHRMKFQTLHFRDLLPFWNGEKDFSQFPARPLILTFDDGYIDNLKNAQPLLEHYGMKATVFLLGNHQILENTWDSGTGETPATLMTLQEKRSLNSQIWEIGSHGFDHLRLTEVPETSALKELRDSKLRLENDFNNPVTSFAYPFGSTNDSLPDLAERAGYAFAVNTDQGGLHLADAPRSIFRVNIFPHENLFSLWKKTSHWYRRYYFRKRQH